MVKNIHAIAHKRVLNDEPRKELKEASNSYMSCLLGQFGPQFMTYNSGEITDYCKEELETLQTKQTEIYGKVL